MFRRIHNALVGIAAKHVGLDEFLLSLGLVLITVAIWPLVGVLALVVPGVAITWIALPSRVPFVARPSDPRKGD